MITILHCSESTMKILRNLYINWVGTLLNDTDEVVGSKYEDLARYHHEMVLMGKEIGLPFWEAANAYDTSKYIPKYKKILEEQGVDPEETKVSHTGIS